MPNEVFTVSGNTALNNLELYKYIRDLKFTKSNSATLKSILFTLVTYRNNTTGQCNPSQISIASGAGCTSRTVTTRIKELVASKILILINLGLIGSNTRNRYYFYYDLETLEEMFNNDDHELHKTNEFEYIEEAIRVKWFHSGTKSFPTKG